MEPCVHYGVTPPCTNIIKKKGVKNVYYAFNDLDDRTRNKSKIILSKKNIKVFKIKNTKYKNFYQSYKVNRNNYLPFVDAKIALSKDNYTINKKKKWITNNLSRIRTHLIRSNYDSVLSTSTSINKDNSLLNCRLNGFDKTKPDLIIIDFNLKIKPNLKLFNSPKKRKIFIVTSILKGEKITYLKKRGIKFLNITSLDTKNDFIKLFVKLKKKGFNRILVETGLKFLNKLLINKLVYNLYTFRSSLRIGKNGLNNGAIKILKKFKIFKKIIVNLNEDKLHMVKIK